MYNPCSHATAYGGYRPLPLRPNLSCICKNFSYFGNIKPSEWMGPLIGIIVIGCQTFSQRGKGSTNEQLSRQTYGKNVTVTPNQTKPNHLHHLSGIFCASFAYACADPFLSCFCSYTPHIQMPCCFSQALYSQSLLLQYETLSIDRLPQQLSRQKLFQHIKRFQFIFQRLALVYLVLESWGMAFAWHWRKSRSWRLWDSCRIGTVRNAVTTFF